MLFYFKEKIMMLKRAGLGHVTLRLLETGVRTQEERET